MFIRIIISSYFLLSILISAHASTCSQTWQDIESSGEIRDKYKHLIGLCGDSFRKELLKLIDGQIYIDYRSARNIMFSELDNEDGIVCSVYSIDRCVETEGIPNPSIMNCEHTWPRSKGAKGLAETDMHHLFPSMSRMNSRRSNHPFCEADRVTWEGYGSKLGYSKFGTRCFSPPAKHRGDVSRAMFYFSVRYKKKIDLEQENFFRKWNEDDKVSMKEVLRNNQIDFFQENRNPFIDHPLFINLITDF